MVTVITTKEELTTPVYNGVTDTGCSDDERLFQHIKDYQEVDFYRTPSCKPLPKDLFVTVDGEVPKSSIKGTFLVQIDSIEPYSQMNKNQNEQNGKNSLLLTITDGVTTINAMTIDTIPNINFTIKLGTKLLLTDTIPIKDGCLQLSNDNTRFQFGSNTYPRPRSAYRGRTSGSSRAPYEGRRNNRYDNDDGESNFFKRPPPKTTLMDFMTSLKLSNDSDTDKFKERNGNTKRQYNHESYPQTMKSNNSISATNNSTHSSHYPMNNNHYSSGVYNDQIVFEHGDIDESLDAEDDSTHPMYRERRNPLPPRLQRAQEERSRRNPARFYDESVAFTGNEPNSIYRNDIISNQSLSSSSYIRRGDQLSYIPNNTSIGHPNAASLNSFMQHPHSLATINGSTPTHVAYFSTNSNPLAYGLAGISNPSYANQQLPVGPGYANDHLTFCYGAPYAIQTYVPSSMGSDVHSDLKNNGSSGPVNTSSDDNDKAITTSRTESQNDDSGNKSDLSASELKPATISSNDSNSQLPHISIEQQEDKRRDSNTNPRPRWKIGDMCLARWSEDGEFYYATVIQIQPPYCAIIFCEYNNYEQVHFSDMKMVPHDQHCYQYVPPSIVPSSDFNPYAATTYFPTRADYYSTATDGCLAMPEAPPFPFNSAGTLYMCPTPLSSVTRSARSNINGYQSQTRRNEYPNSTVNSSSPPSKDSDDTSAIDSTTTSNDDQQQQQQQQQQDFSFSSIKPRPCSIADAPLTLVTNSDDLLERSTSPESLPTNNNADEQQQQSTNAETNH